MDYKKTVEDFCLKQGSYKIFKTLTGASNFASLCRFTFHKNRKAIEENIMNRNIILKPLSN